LAAGALPRTPLGELTALSRPSSWKGRGSEEEGRMREKQVEREEEDAVVVS